MQQENIPPSCNLRKDTFGCLIGTKTIVPAYSLSPPMLLHHVTNIYMSILNFCCEKQSYYFFKTRTPIKSIQYKKEQCIYCVKIWPDYLPWLLSPVLWYLAHHTTGRCTQIVTVDRPYTRLLHLQFVKYHLFREKSLLIYCECCVMVCRSVQQLFRLLGTCG